MAGSPARVQFGPVTLVPDERVLLKDGQPIALTPKTFDLLVFLAANPGRLLTKDEILRAVWPDAVVEESNLAYHVFAIRKALGNGWDTDRYIETVPKQGYRFIAPIMRLEDPVAVGGVELAPLVAPSVEARTGAVTVGRRSLRDAPWFAWVLGLTGLVVGAGGAGFFGLQPRSGVGTPAPLRLQEPLWGRPAEPPMFSIAPDGLRLMMAIKGFDGVTRLWVRALSESSPRPLPESEGFLTPPAIWSPRGDAVAFANGGPLKQVMLAGGVPHTVCEVSGLAVGGSWNHNDVILVGNPAGPLLRCPASGGSATPVTQTADPREIHLMPSFLSDERHFIYLRIHRAAPERSGVYVGDLNGSSPADEKRLLATGFNAIHVPESESGASAIVFVRDGALFAQRFDEQRLELRGAPVQLADRVGSYLDYAFFSASPRMLVYRQPDPPYQLTWFDREGHEVRRVGAPEPVAGLALSPSGDRALVVRHVPHNVVDQDLWRFDLLRDENPVRLTFAPSLESLPTWLTNERFAYVASGGEPSMYEQTIGGQRRIWFQNGGATGVTAVDEGRVAVFGGHGSATTRADLWAWTEKGPADGAPLITHEGDQAQPQLSPDGQWLAYVSNETGRDEVFVAPFRYDTSTGEASVGESVPVSDGGGFAPRWRGDGRELFYLKIDGSVMAVTVNRTAGVPKSATRLFIAAGVFPEWGVTHDGRRLLLAVPTGPPPPLQIIQNWQSLLPN